MAEDNRALDIGDKVGDLEVTAVSYQEKEGGERHNFEYHLKHPEDIQKAPEHGVEMDSEQALASQSQALVEQPEA